MSDPTGCRPAGTTFPAPSSSKRNETGSSRQWSASAQAKGYARLNIADLASEAGISKSTFYKHFRDKESCFLDTYDTVTSLFVAETIKAFETEDLEWPAQLEFAIRVAFGYMAAHPLEAKVITVDVMIAGPAAMERYSAARRVLATIIDRGRSHEGSNTDVPPAMAGGVINGGALLIRHMLLSGEIDTLPQAGPDYLYWALAPYLGETEAKKWAERARRKLED